MRSRAFDSGSSLASDFLGPVGLGFRSGSLGASSGFRVERLRALYEFKVSGFRVEAEGVRVGI